MDMGAMDQGSVMISSTKLARDRVDNDGRLGCSLDRIISLKGPFAPRTPRFGGIWRHGRWGGQTPRTSLARKFDAGTPCSERDKHPSNVPHYTHRTGGAA